ncbi:Peptide chain release factor 1 [Pirellula sp. SH-Sr6A]|uniref:peptide chain release factor 1 n=1 Tax=Pirellula sp. SH-Sr6A TaxID=1632865 RepID=UPI00078D3C79|nr:peptide chain release factor 1 [Pirellula sp. SH-Sr6A]AMV32688.1 Peptide chain release factor 1 [Pirellula sp. SH-Sr6A]
MNIREQLDQNLARFEELEQMMSDPEVLGGDSSKMAGILREHGGLLKAASKYRRYKKLGEELKELDAMLQSSDSDEREMAQEEISKLREERETIWNELLDMSIGGEDANRTRCVMEIRAGTGGEEAALFARDLYEMYKRHADLRHWKVEIMDSSISERGGFKEIILGLEGEGVFRELQFESGGHRVQRVPETEAQGRIHTSAATVAVMAEPEDIEVELKPEDYRVDKFCASGPGGQHVNKTESAIRLTHLETGIVVQCQDEKSQHKNLARAIRVLKSRLYEVKREQELKRQSDQRMSLIGSGDRSERIRTYNFPQNRLTDHRINLTLYKLDQIMAGNMQPVTDALLEYERSTLRDDTDT